MTDRRAEVARVAATAIEERGLEGASLREVAARTGATLGVVTYHFRNRQDLLVATMAEVAASLRSRADDLVARSGDAVTGNLLPMLPLDPASRTDCAVWLAYAAAAARDDSLRADFDGYYREWQDAVAAALADRGVDEPSDTAAVLTAATDGLALRALGQRMAAARQRALLGAAVAAVVGKPPSD